MATNEDTAVTIQRLVNGMFQVVLGALILWIGQTTFRHTDSLAGFDEKLDRVNQQFDEVEKQQQRMKDWLETVVGNLKDQTRSQFTALEGDKLGNQIRHVEVAAQESERRLVERVNAMELKLAALDAQHQDSPAVAALKWEVSQLRSELANTVALHEAQMQQARLTAPDRVAREVPIYLPPVETPR